MTSTAETGSSQQTVRVAVAVPLDRTFDYNHSGLGALSRGTIVSVPFGPRQLNGIVLGPGDGAIAATMEEMLSQVKNNEFAMDVAGSVAPTQDATRDPSPPITIS